MQRPKPKIPKPLFLKPMPINRKKKCKWTYKGPGYYHTACGINFLGSHIGFIYCPYCGKEIEWKK